MRPRFRREFQLDIIPIPENHLSQQYTVNQTDSAESRSLLKEEYPYEV